MRSAVVTTILGLCCAGSVAWGPRPKGARPHGDAFDRLSSKFVIRDWISFAKDEYEKLESDQARTHPRYYIIVSNEQSGRDDSGIVAVPVAYWGLGSEPIPSGAFVFIPDPIRQAAVAGVAGEDLRDVIVFGGARMMPRDEGLIIGQNQ